MGNRSMFVGLEVHKETIDVSIADGDRHGEVRHYGMIASDLEPLDKVVKALRAPKRTGAELVVNGAAWDRHVRWWRCAKVPMAFLRRPMLPAQRKGRRGSPGA